MLYGAGLTRRLLSALDICLESSIPSAAGSFSFCSTAYARAPLTLFVLF